MQITPFMRHRRLKQKFRRRGFALGLCAGIGFIAYKLFKYPGSIHRTDAMHCLALVLFFGLCGGLIGMALGAIFGASESENGR